MSYELFIRITKDPKYYEGRVKVLFVIGNRTIRSQLKELFLDFHGHSIQELTINELKIPLYKVKF